MEIIKGDHEDIYSWVTDPEEGALEQARNVARLPGVVGHVALMPDAHQGYGMPIGGVVALQGAVCPNCVGVDIGCGMRALEFDLHVEDLPLEKLKEVMGEIRERVPVGFEHHKHAKHDGWTPGGPIGEREHLAALKQAGTLGGGNHFIELQKDERGKVWVMVHSGSRNVGKQIADHYYKLAKERNYYGLDPKWQLDLLPVDSPEGAAYIKEMEAALTFARWNRKEIMDAILGVIWHRVAMAPVVWSLDVHHNYATPYGAFGAWVHRKGATYAGRNAAGIIPGSQGSKSYITQGKGSLLSLESSSHGAGRKMGRKQATRELDLAAEVERLNSLGVVHSVRTRADLEEAPSAYKDIDLVMANQADLVEVLHTLSPLGVIKG